MKKSHFNFPHPVLNNDSDDYLDCSFSVRSDVIQLAANKDFQITSEYTLESPELTKMIENDTANALLRIECPETSYRKMILFKDNDNKVSFNIGQNDIANKLKISGYIVAKNTVPDFLPAECNKDYFSFPFSISPGDILAYEHGENIYFDASELEKPISSIIFIAKNEQMNEPIFIDFNEEKIFIYLDKTTYDNYYRCRKKAELKRFLAGIVVLPAIMEAICIMKSEYKEDYSEKRWYRNIEKKLKDNNIDIDDDNMSVKTANKLLGDIVNCSINSLYETFESDFAGTEIEQMGGID